MIVPLDARAAAIDNAAWSLILTPRYSSWPSGSMQITFDDPSNDVFHSEKPKPRVIDYILTRNSDKIGYVDRRVALLTSKWGMNKEYLSDHNGIEATIEFKNTQIPYLSNVQK